MILTNIRKRSATLRLAYSDIDLHEILPVKLFRVQLQSSANDARAYYRGLIKSKVLATRRSSGAA
jgi:hypothetical protein